MMRRIVLLFLLQGLWHHSAAEVLQVPVAADDTTSTWPDPSTTAVTAEASSVTHTAAEVSDVNSSNKDCTLPSSGDDCQDFSELLLGVFGQVDKDKLEEILDGNETGDADLRMELVGRGLLDPPETTSAPSMYWRLQEILQMVGENDTWDFTGISNHLNVDVSNLTDSEAKNVFHTVHSFILQNNLSEAADNDMMASLLFAISSVSTVDEDMLTVYAESTALLIGNEEHIVEKKSAKEAVAVGIIVSMERVMITANVSRHEQELDQLTLSVKSVTVPVADRSLYPGVKIKNKKNVLWLCPTLFPSHKGRVSSVVYKDLHHMLPSNKKGALKGGALASHVMSVIVQTSDQEGYYNGEVQHGNDLNFTINFTLPFFHPQMPDRSHTRWCVFWEMTLSMWSEEGCWILEQNETHTSCTCSHLSTFAVLVTYTDTVQVSAVSEEAMFILTVIGCSLSIAGLTLTLCTYIYLRILHRERVLIHANLAASLLLAQVLFIFSDDAHNDETACRVVAMVLHFLFLSAFSWMLMEGFVLYRTCTRGLLSTCDMRAKYLVMGWGLPLVVVLISLGAEFPSYGHGSENSCWLSAEEGLIWAFLAPMLVVVLLNIVILGLVIRVFLTLRANSQKSETARIRAGVRAMVMLLPLLGTTWLLSLLVPLSPVFSYLFIVCNSLQGLMIFLLHCLCNEEVRRFLAKKRSGPMSRTRTSETNVSVVWHRRLPGVAFDDVHSAKQTQGPDSQQGQKCAWMNRAVGIPKSRQRQIVHEAA